MTAQQTKRKSKCAEMSSNQLQQCVEMVMKTVIPRIDCSIKEAFKSFADDYLLELKHLKISLDEIKASQQFLSKHEIKASQQFLSKQFDEINNKINDEQKSNTKKSEKATRTLSSKIEALEKANHDEYLKIDKLEQYGQRLNLEFEGVPEKINENVTEIVVDLAKRLNVEADFSDVSIAHRLPGKKRKQNGVTPPATIIVQFTNKRVRNLTYANRKQVKSLTEFPVPDMHRLFVNEQIISFILYDFWKNFWKKPHSF